MQKSVKVILTEERSQSRDGKVRPARVVGGGGGVLRGRAGRGGGPLQAEAVQPQGDADGSERQALLG